MSPVSLLRHPAVAYLYLDRPSKSEAQALFAIEDEDVWQPLVHEVHGHRQRLEVGRNSDFASSHNLAFEFLG